MAPPPRVLLVVGHPVIASGIETLLKLEGDFDVRRAATLADVVKNREWGPQVALVDGALLGGYSTFNIGVPAYVLSGNERDGRQLARKLDDGRGWLRKDATGPELALAIAQLMTGTTPSEGGLGTLGTAVVAIVSVIALGLVTYLVWLALY